MDTSIREIRTWIVKPGKHNLLVVRIQTEDGLMGYGCATFQFRPTSVQDAIKSYLSPFLLGKDARNITDLWQAMFYNSYWRGGPVLNNAIAGIDMALWDLQAKRAHMPLYQLLGGRTKNKVLAYTHAVGTDIDDCLEQIARFKHEGYTHIRIQVGGYGDPQASGEKNLSCLPGEYFCPQSYAQKQLELFRRARETFGYELEFLHDVHERLDAVQAKAFLRGLEPYKPYFIEDIIPFEQLSQLKELHDFSSVPLAFGELVTSPAQILQLIQTHAIDFVRVHVSMIGGITPALKLAHTAELYNVKIAWHTPSDISPIGLAVNTHLNMALSACAIQEHIELNDDTLKLFPGAQQCQHGSITPREVPGIGVEIDEILASSYPGVFKEHPWTQSRIADGTIVAP